MSAFIAECPVCSRPNHDPFAPMPGQCKRGTLGDDGTHTRECYQFAIDTGKEERASQRALAAVDEAKENANLRAEVTPLESLLAIERGHTAALESNESHWIAELDATRARLTAAEGDAGRLREALKDLSEWRCGCRGGIDDCNCLPSIREQALAALTPPTGHAAGETLLDEIAKERKRQEAKWGEQNAHFRLGDWMSCLGNIALKARAKSDLPGETRRELVKLAALVMRASDANGGHAAGEVAACPSTCASFQMEGGYALQCDCPPPVDERPELTEWRSILGDRFRYIVGDEEPGRQVMSVERDGRDSTLFIIYSASKNVYPCAQGESKNFADAEMKADSHPTRIKLYRLPCEARRGK